MVTLTEKEEKKKGKRSDPVLRKVRYLGGWCFWSKGKVSTKREEGRKAGGTTTLSVAISRVPNPW
jgi:hypothetical protein